MKETLSNKDVMITLPEYMTWNMFLKQNAKYVINYGRYAQFFYSERAVINFLHQNRYRWRDVKSLCNGEWETKNKRMKIRKVKVTAAPTAKKTEKKYDTGRKTAFTPRHCGKSAVWLERSV